MTKDRTARIFGAVLLEQRRVMEELAGPEVFREVLEGLQPDMRSEYEGLGMLSWCRHTTATEVTTRVGLALGRLPEDFQAEVVRTGIERTLRGIWRVLLRFSSDDALIKRAALIYSKTCDRGKLSVEPIRPGHVDLILTEWPDIANLDIVALAAGVETVLRVVGRSAARVTWHRETERVVFQVHSTEPPPAS
jgi:hypothetical protein